MSFWLSSIRVCVGTAEYVMLKSFSDWQLKFKRQRGNGCRTAGVMDNSGKTFKFGS